jgi:hypothetical protein
MDYRNTDDGGILMHAPFVKHEARNSKFVESGYHPKTVANLAFRFAKRLSAKDLKSTHFSRFEMASMYVF